MNGNTLVVGDEKELVDLAEVYLKSDRYNVCRCYSGTDALRCVETAELDLVILGIMFPDIDGFQICQKIQEKFYFPVVTLTAKVEDGDKIMGLSAANDYTTKLFDPLKVVVKVETQLRRYMQYKQPCIKQEAERTECDTQGMTISKSNYECILFGKEIQLAPTGFSILWYLYERQGTVVSAEELFEVVRGERYSNSNNTVTTHIKRPRGKMKGPLRNPKFIEAVWEVEYTTEK